EATSPARLRSDVIVVHRRDTLRASKIRQDRARANPKIKFIWNAEVADILGDSKPAVYGVVLRDTRTGEKTEHSIDGVFVAIGHQPNTAFLGGQLPTDELGYLKVQAGTTLTSVPGVFVAGDVADPVYRQAVTAAGSGCM